MIDLEWLSDMVLTTKQSRRRTDGSFRLDKQASQVLTSSAVVMVCRSSNIFANVTNRVSGAMYVRYMKYGRSLE